MMNSKEKLDKKIDEILLRYEQEESLSSIAESLNVSSTQLSNYLQAHHYDTYRRMRITRAIVAAEKLNYITDETIEFVSKRISNASLTNSKVTEDAIRLFAQCSKNTHWRAEKEAVEIYGNKQRIEHDLSSGSRLAQIMFSLKEQKKERENQIQKLKRVK